MRIAAPADKMDDPLSADLSPVRPQCIRFVERDPGYTQLLRLEQDLVIVEFAFDAANPPLAQATSSISCSSTENQ
jgi:hypothetical protein